MRLASRHVIVNNVSLSKSYLYLANGIYCKIYDITWEPQYGIDTSQRTGASPSGLPWRFQYQHGLTIRIPRLYPILILLSPPTSPSPYLPSLSLSHFLSTRLSICLPTYLSNYLSMYPSVHPSTHPPTYLPIHLSVYLFIFVSFSLSFSVFSVHIYIYVEMNMYTYRYTYKNMYIYIHRDTPMHMFVCFFMHAGILMYRVAPCSSGFRQLGTGWAPAALELANGLRQPLLQM